MIAINLINIPIHNLENNTGQIKGINQNPRDLENHGFEKAVLNSSKPKNIVLDLFGDSGSTLIACQKNNRISYNMELDPKYCDVIIKRWQDFTGKDAKLAATGQSFNELE